MGLPRRAPCTRYMMVCMMLLFWLTMTHAGASGLTRRLMSFEQQDQYDHIVEKVDGALFALSFTLWVLFNIGFGLYHTVFHTHANYMVEDDGFQNVGELINWHSDWLGKVRPSTRTNRQCYVPGKHMHCEQTNGHNGTVHRSPLHNGVHVCRGVCCARSESFVSLMMRTLLE